MNKRVKSGLLIAVAVILLGVLLTLSYFVWQIPLFDGSGWVTADDGRRMYLDYYGSPSTGWVRVEDRLYYFSPKDCGLQTGWLETEEGRHYLGEDGAARTGWAELEDERYYFDETGALHVGWLKTEAGRYYFSSSGKMMTGWLKSGEKRYYLAADGKMHTGWLELEGERYYLNEDGSLQVSWLELDGRRYFFNVDGTMRTGWLHSSQGVFFLTQSGAAHTGWLKTETGRMYMGKDGAMSTGFIEVAGIERYFSDSGIYVPLVNRDHPVPEDYTPDLVEVEGFLVDATCRDALVEMIAAARAAGHTVKINSAFRDVEKQQSVWEEYRTDYMAEGYSYEEAEKMTARYVAVPGTSEHHLGLAIDFGNYGDIYAWLAEHSWEYGFILRYLEDQTEAFGAAYEPWHYRYVGEELAKPVYESGVMLETYFESIK